MCKLGPVGRQLWGTVGDGGHRTRTMDTGAGGAAVPTGGRVSGEDSRRLGGWGAAVATAGAASVAVPGPV